MTQVVTTQEQRDVVAEQAGAPTPMELQLDSKAVITRIGAVAEVISGCAKASLQRTNAADWVKMGDKYYLQATGAQKVRPVWGIYYRDRKVTFEQLPGDDAGYAYIVEGKVGSKVLDQLYGETVIEIDGGRSSKDPFFTKGDREPDPMDVRKAALANWEARAVAALLGLKNFTDEDLKTNGVAVDKIIGVSYQSGAEGGGKTNLISAKQCGRLYAISQGQGISEQNMKDFLQAYGYSSSKDIERDKYEEICALTEQGVSAMAKKMAELRGDANA